MKKLIIDDVTYKIEKEEDQKAFIEKMKEVKSKLKKINLLPTKFSLYRDIDKDKDTFKLYMVFDSDEDFDKWDEKFPQEIRDIFINYFRKYLIKYNYSEEIDID
ncbi:MAG: hypothetical protein HPAVJP_0710 [Candidatus Hepatoplasma vulgare]|nr:MAG: hypothetical protein HPAVJP_0710 [Candidatus Hepatoplasma sp.]